MNYRMEYFRWSFISTIQIRPTKRAPVVSINNTIRIKHWYNLKDELFSECSCLWSAAHQELNKAFHHPGGIWFSRMNSCRNYDSLFSHWFLAHWVLKYGCYSYLLTLIPCKCSTKSCPCEKISCIGIFFNSSKIILQIWVCIGETVCKINLVIIMLKYVSKSLSVIVTWKSIVFFFVIILEIGYILTCSMPSEIILFFTLTWKC